MAPAPLYCLEIVKPGEKQLHRIQVYKSKRVGRIVGLKELREDEGKIQRVDIHKKIVKC